MIKKIILSFLLFSFGTFVFADDSKQVVVMDSDGKPVLPSNQYYFVPPPGAKFGGLTLYQLENFGCATSVTQLRTNTGNGQSIKFIVNRSNRILTGTPLDIEFAVKPSCTKTSKWSAFYDNYLNINFLGIGGPEDNRSNPITSGQFHIELSRNDNSSIYKLVFCASGSNDCKPVSTYDSPSKDVRELILNGFGDYSEFTFVRTTRK